MMTGWRGGEFKKEGKGERERGRKGEREGEGEGERERETLKANWVSKQLSDIRPLSVHSIH